jgi:hypothetical protein
MALPLALAFHILESLELRRNALLLNLDLLVRFVQFLDRDVSGVQRRAHECVAT